MTRYECLQLLAPKITDEIVVANLGGVARELYDLKDRDGNLYRPYLGHATSLALGLALALPHRRVLSLDGDGSMLFSLTVLPVIAQQNPSNLVVIVFDNQVYEACSKAPSFTAGATDLSGMARTAGIPNTWLVRELPEFERTVDEAFEAKGASFITTKVEMSPRRVSYSTLDGVENKYRFIRYIESTENIQIFKPPIKPLPQDG